MAHSRLMLAAALAILASACTNPEADWQAAETENTEASYQAFLENHPEGEWAQRAEAALDAIKDARDWEAAQTSDVIEAYNNYLLAHPTGTHMGEARQRITELETEDAWNTAVSAGSREALEDFLLRYPDSPQAEQARAQLVALTPPPLPEPKPAPKPAAKPAPKPAAAKTAAPPKGNFQVQLGAFSAKATAQTEKSRLESRHRSITGALHIEQSGDKLFRVKSAGMTEAAARSACQQLKSRGQDCMVAKR
ncbi:MAG: hypothetical protein FJ197_05600 [Gammaproteobacteria bacterium]|nr:hypothetical protein [Gammaproteobacteria bacterium]